MLLSSLEIIALIGLQLERAEPDADRIAELAAELKQARQREQANTRDEPHDEARNTPRS
jgi:hypothetical protein